MSRSPGKKNQLPTAAPNPGPPLENPAESYSWPGWARILVSLLILFHLTAVIIAPLTMLMPAPSLTVPVQEVCAPYQQATYLNHGYQFFAPDPGPSHFVQYIVVTNQGERIEGRFPDRDQHRPRLHYHRWFMLAERLYSLNDQILSDQELNNVLKDIDRQIAEANRNANSEAARFMTREKRLIAERNLQLKQQAARLARGIHQQLAKKFDARSIEIYCVERLIPAPYQVTTEHKSIDDPQFIPVDRRIKLTIQAEPDPNAEEIR